MIYVRSNLRYVMYAMPDLYVEYGERANKIWQKWNTGQGWSFTSGVGGPAKDFGLLRKWLHLQLESSI